MGRRELSSLDSIGDDGAPEQPSPVGADWAAEQDGRADRGSVKAAAEHIPAETMTREEYSGYIHGEQAWLAGPDRPQDLASTRPYGQDGGLSQPDPVHQRELEDAVPRQEDGRPERFPGPRQRWAELINDGGPAADQLRGNNCLDCSLSLISTWHGQPEVAAPRFPDRRPDGSVDTRLGESNGPKRAEEWLGQNYEYLGGPEDAQREIARRLDAGGHGSSAAIITAWKEGGSHAWNAVNYRGDILWVDSQVSRIGAEPLYAAADIDRVWAITVDREGKTL